MSAVHRETLIVRLMQLARRGDTSSEGETVIREAIDAIRTLDLRRWVQHLPKCDKRMMQAYSPSMVCSCGLDAALSAHETPEP